MNILKCFISLYICSVFISSLMSRNLPGHNRPNSEIESWSADNGNGTFTNPLFYDEFSDPDIIRVDDDYYLAGTTMHSVPGLVILHSRDLVNWKNVGYCFDRFDFDDPAFSLKEGKEVYGQGIWAPCIRYHNGRFYLFSNVNGKGLQCFISERIEGPWQHVNMQGRIYDLSVLFDDDGKIYAIHGYGTVRCSELKPDMSGPIEGTERVIIEEGNIVGEGHHIYKINGIYYILSADYAPVGKMTCARSSNIYGPYEVCVISAGETYGYHPGHMTQFRGRIPNDNTPIKITAPNPNSIGCATIHQGGIVQAQDGTWWGLSMQDFHSIGRTTCLSPITWHNGWPFFGLSGNLGRSPRTWLKPQIGKDVEPHSPYRRSDDFSQSQLLPIWQWNHNPDDKRWSINKRKGVLRLHTMPASQLLWARNTLTQRVIGPQSITTVEVNVSRLEEGDIAGLGNINIPYSYIGLIRIDGNTIVRWFDRHTNEITDTKVTLNNDKIWFRFSGDYDNDCGEYAYSLDGINFIKPGKKILLGYQLVTFQGSRLGLFAYNTLDRNGGYADFDNFVVYEPMADRSENIPFGKTIRLINLADDRVLCMTKHGHFIDDEQTNRSPATHFKVIDLGEGQVVLQVSDGRYLYVTGEGLMADVRLTNDFSKAEKFMWQDMLQGECMLLSMSRHLYIGKNPLDYAPYHCEAKGADPARRNGAVFRWEEVK